MPTMNISLPESLRAFVEEQISRRRYGTTSEYRFVDAAEQAFTQIARQPSIGSPGTPSTSTGRDCGHTR
ncbi:MAG: type II toxin-antitoxin system ParD family antitoxin [Nitriliruptoraceae bacterium]